MMPRHDLYLDDDLSAQLDALSGVPGSSKSAIVADALRQYLKYRGGTDQDDAIKIRLDRLSRHHERMECDLAIVIETLTGFIDTYLAATAHMLEPDPAARAKAHEKMQAFIKLVGTNLASGKRSEGVQIMTEAQPDNERQA